MGQIEHQSLRWAMAAVVAVMAFLPSGTPARAYQGAPSRPLFRPAALQLTAVATGLASPLQVTHAGDGSGRLFIVEQGGVIKIVRAGAVLATPFLDISGRIVSGGEQGLLSVAFHPQYAANGRFFVNYTADQNGLRTIVAEYRVSANPDVAGTAETVILDIAQPFANHNGGLNKFGPDGMFYIGTGDGGSAGDPLNNGQRLDTLLGKILRIDVNVTSSAAATTGGASWKAHTASIRPQAARRPGCSSQSASTATPKAVPSRAATSTAAGRSRRCAGTISSGTSAAADLVAAGGPAGRLDPRSAAADDARNQFVWRGRIRRGVCSGSQRRRVPNHAALGAAVTRASVETLR